MGPTESHESQRQHFEWWHLFNIYIKRFVECKIFHIASRRFVNIRVSHELTPSYWFLSQIYQYLFSIVGLSFQHDTSIFELVFISDPKCQLMMRYNVSYTHTHQLLQKCVDIRWIHNNITCTTTHKTKEVCSRSYSNILYSQL